jgi:hypothetical protein
MGPQWILRIEKKPAGAPAMNGTVPAPPTKQRPQEVMMQVPILQRAMEVFDALPMFVDPGFGAAPSNSTEPAHPVPTGEEVEES